MFCAGMACKLCAWNSSWLFRRSVSIKLVLATSVAARQKIQVVLKRDISSSKLESSCHGVFQSLQVTVASAVVSQEQCHVKYFSEVFYTILKVICIVYLKDVCFYVILNFIFMMRVTVTENVFVH